MCLNKVHTSEEQEEVIAKLKAGKDGYIILYKVFCVNENKELIATFKDYQFYEGKNTAKEVPVSSPMGVVEKKSKQYPTGFHSFTNRKDAEDWKHWCNTPYAKSKELVVYPVKIKKEWIVTTGQEIYSTVLVSKHIII
jgi:hypothetical protein